MSSKTFLSTSLAEEISKCNKEQQKAIKTIRGRVLIIAGAGSGKTSVITKRIAHLIQDHQISPSTILGLTFTNKAAEEMRERIAKLLDRETAKQVMLSTFHSFCMYVLRREIHHLGYTKEFSLYDERDIKRLLKHLAKHHAEDQEELEIDPLVDDILHAKQNGHRSQEFNHQDPLAHELFRSLEISLRAYNAVDFDTLLSLTVELFEKHPEVLERYQRQFHYIMIDEYQDTNYVQDRIAQLLAEKEGNICVVGDDDQSIYSWRGAKIANILQFKADTVVKLQQNYRCTPYILTAANHVIANNQSRHEKWLISHKTEGDPIHLFHAATEQYEAQAVIDRLLYLREEKGLQWNDMAILYRSNRLNRPFEIALMGTLWKENGQWRRGIPYEIFGGLELLERTEIKDLIAYLRVIANPFDQEALLRVINYPRRGISPKTLDYLTKINRKEERSIWSVLEDVSHGKFDLQLTTMGRRGINNFLLLIEEMQRNYREHSFYRASTLLIEKIDLKRQIFEEMKNDKTSQFKWENVVQFLAMLKSMEEESQGKTNSLQEFIGSMTLDRGFRKKKDIRNNSVKLLTFHSSKGLEFPACFLIGLEDHIVPHERGVIENSLEEERRLFYVAMTRAKQYLTLSMSRTRKSRSKEFKTSPSRFLYEIPKQYLLMTSSRTPEAFIH